jgi:hypothetical protein
LIQFYDIAENAEITLESKLTTNEEKLKDDFSNSDLLFVDSHNQPIRKKILFIFLKDVVLALDLQIIFQTKINFEMVL